MLYGEVGEEYRRLKRTKENGERYMKNKISLLTHIKSKNK